MAQTSDGEGSQTLVATLEPVFGVASVTQAVDFDTPVNYRYLILCFSTGWTDMNQAELRLITVRSEAKMTADSGVTTNQIIILDTDAGISG